MIEELKRRDKMFVILFFLSAFVMFVANPADYDIRSVAWDFSMAVIFLGGVFWLLSEIGSQIGDMVFDIPLQDKRVPKSTSRVDLIEMAGDATGVRKEILGSMTDVELVGLIENNGVASSGNIVPLHVIVISLFKLTIKVLKTIIKIVVGAPKAVKNIPQTVRSKIVELKKMWSEEMSK